MKQLLLEKGSDFYLKIVALSLIVSQNYFFLWNKRFLIHPNYLFFNTFYLLLFSFLFFFLLIKFTEKTKYFQFLKILIYSYILVKLIEIPFFYSNILTLSDLMKNFYLFFFKNSLLIMFLKKITPFILTYLFLSVFFKKYEIFIKKFVLIFSLIFLLILCYSMMLRITNYDKTKINNQQIVKQNKVIWLILDEFDPQIAFEKENNLKNFKSLLENSFSLTNSFSPSSHTMESIPSIFMSRNVKEIEYKNFRIFFTNHENIKKEFNFKNTFFHSLDEKKFSFQIISEVLPYCFMLGLEDNCIKNQAKQKNYFDSIISTFTPYSYMRKLYEIIYLKGKQNSFINENVNANVVLNDNFYLSKKLNFKLKDFEDTIKSTNNLTLIHLFLPKSNTIASKHVEKFYKTKVNDGLEKYKLMLNYTDLIIEGIMDKIQEQNDDEIMILITSDHWLRVSSNDPKPSLFIAKILGDETKLVNEKKIMNIFIPNLISNFLQNKIKTHLEINDYIKTFDDINLSLIKNNLK